MSATVRSRRLATGRRCAARALICRSAARQEAIFNNGQTLVLSVLGSCWFLLLQVENRGVPGPLLISVFFFVVASGCDDAGSSGSLLLERDRGPPEGVHRGHSALLGL